MKQNMNDANWVKLTLEAMTLKEKIGQLMQPLLAYHLTNPQTFGDFAEKYHLGGGHMGGWNKEQFVMYTEMLQSRAKIPLLISGDMYGGAGPNIHGGSAFPSQLALGAANSEALAYRMGEATAVENLALGLNWTFSPVIDICGHREHLRQTESVGEDPRQVARLTCAEIRGLQDHGMVATAKHFPGDGFDDRDQHITTSVNNLSEKEWWLKSGYVFKKAIEAGVWSIMNACIALPSMDKDCGSKMNPRPVCLSKYMTTGILRKKMGFDGVLVTDALNMGGVAMHEPLMERQLQCFEAGNDMLLFVTRLEETIAYFEYALKRRRITEKRLNESVVRILTLKTKIGLHKQTTLKERQARLSIFRNSPYVKDANELAEKSITLLKDSRKIIPLKMKKGTRIGHILITNRPERFKADAFNAELERNGYPVTLVVNPDMEQIYPRVEKKEFDVIITSFHYPSDWGWCTTRIHGPHSRALMSGYYLANKTVPALFVSFNSPNHLYELAVMDPFLVTYGNANCSQVALAKAILGKIPIQGKVPVSLPGYFKRGDGLKTKVS